MMKACVVLLFKAWPGLYRLGDWLLGWLSNRVDAQGSPALLDDSLADPHSVIFTMCIVPVVMNVLQFLVIDSIIKDRHRTFFQRIPTTDEESCRSSQMTEEADEEAGKAVVSQPAATPPLGDTNQKLAA
jgi:hypothetical protein